MTFKHKAIAVLEKQLTKQAIVLEVRAWEAGTFFEVDLHVPDADFTQLKGVAHMKCRVAPLNFRDYTISGWDAETKTCTLFIDAAHRGAGSAWVKTLQRNGWISYLKMETHRYQLSGQSNHLFLGDQSAIGHFLALQQLAGEGAIISGAVIMPNAAHRSQFKYDHPLLNLTPLPLQQTYSETIIQWLQQQHLTQHGFICIAGQTKMVIDVRHYLKWAGISGAQIKAQGFWD